MKQDFDDCYDEIEDIDINIVDYKVLNDIEQNKRKIKKLNKIKMSKQNKFEKE